MLPTFDEILASRAVQMCLNRVTKERKEEAAKNAQELLKIERHLGVPDLMRGMTLAAACMESGFNARALGDRRFDPKGRPKAVGILQLWPWVKAHGVNRRDLNSSANFWVSHVKRVKAKTDRRCRSKNALTSWRQAWVTAVRAPRPRGRCKESPKHWPMFKKLRAEKTKIRNQIRGWYNELEKKDRKEGA
jgi:hypothetical protein